MNNRTRGPPSETGLHFLKWKSRFQNNLNCNYLDSGELTGIPLLLPPTALLTPAPPPIGLNLLVTKVRSFKGKF